MDENIKSSLPENVVTEMNNVIINSVPKIKQTTNILQHSVTDTNENNNKINTIIDGNLQQHKTSSTSNGSINGIIQATNEKLSFNKNNERRTDSLVLGKTKIQTQQTTTTTTAAPWTLKKSTQSVAVSVVPSNNYPIQRSNGNASN